jgi:hypothetical protein
MALAAGGMVWMTPLGLDSGYAADVLPPLLVTGFGIGLVMPAAMSVATERVAESDAGVASAAVNTMQQVGGAIGTALLNTLAASALAGYESHHTGPLVKAEAALHSYSTAYWWSAGFFAVGALLAMAMYRAGRSTDDAPAGQVVHM